MKKNKIFVACDTSNINFVRKIIQNTKNRKLEIIKSPNDILTIDVEPQLKVNFGNGVIFLL